MRAHVRACARVRVRVCVCLAVSNALNLKFAAKNKTTKKKKHNYMSFFCHIEFNNHTYFACKSNASSFHITCITNEDFLKLNTFLTIWPY